MTQPEELKYLGIHLDRKLTWRKHISTKRKQLDLKLRKLYRIDFMFEFPCIISLYYIKNQQDATLAVLFISNCKITLHVSATDLGRPYWIYITPTHDMHQWLLLQFLVLLLMDAERVRNM